MNLALVARQYSSDGSSSSGSAIDTQGGASGGPSNSFNLSKGGLIAICIVVALVVIFGTASTVLFILAKRRQWNVRASIRRASRRLTGRGDRRAPSRAGERQSKRVGMQMSSIPATRGHKRGSVVEVQDVEKGNQQPQQEEGGFMGKLWRNGWKK